MSTPGPTIIDLKTAFLRAQILALTRPLTIPTSFTTKVPATLSPSDHLRQKSIDEALYKLNTLIKQHGKLVYPSFAQRHVAEQIDALYWAAGDGETVGGGGEGEEILRRGADFANETTITSLPTIWDSASTSTTPSTTTVTAQSETYSELATQLKALSTRRSALQARVQKYTALKEALEVFEQPTENVQGNLATRDGELEGELERMRGLLARIVGRVEGLEGNGAGREGDENDMDVDVDLDGAEEEGRKVKILLGLS